MIIEYQSMYSAPWPEKFVSFKSKEEEEKLFTPQEILLLQ